jgi:hypothetical protein
MLIYLASPYNHKNPAIREQRYKEVLKATAKLIKAGCIIYSPIVHNHFVALQIEESCGSHAGFDKWERFDCKMISRCDELWVLKIDGWEKSVGIAGEIKFAQSMSMKIKYVTMEDLGIK